jgi:hypothetical protein
MIDLQKDYHTLKELRAQLQEAVDQLQEEGDSLTVDLELGIGDTQEKAKRLLELSLLLLQAKMAIPMMDEAIEKQKQQLVASLN